MMILRTGKWLRRGLILLVCGYAWAASAAEKVHVVKSTETLNSIAQKYGVSAAAVARRNQLKDANRLLVGQRLVIPRKEYGTTRYTVQKGDSLASIAKKMGVSLKTLQEINGLPAPDKILPGQTLVIPDSGKVEFAESGLDPKTRERLNRIRVSRRWENIVIHHSATPVATPSSMDAYHHARGMENGLAYHFVIGNGWRMRDGEIYIGQRWIKQLDGGHLHSEELNRSSIGICLVGDFDQAPPSSAQLQALQVLTRYLMQRCRIKLDHVKTHRQINTRPTECPGRKFPTARFLKGL